MAKHGKTINRKNAAAIFISEIYKTMISIAKMLKLNNIRVELRGYLIIVHQEKAKLLFFSRNRIIEIYLNVPDPKLS
jgi:hypothetical protein